MMRMFPARKSNPTVVDEDVASTSRRLEEEGTTVTNYRSFSEHRSVNNSRTRRNPVNLISSHEALLEDHRNLNDTTYRGFSTSIHDMFISTEYERVDCCAMTCGGIFQSDRDRFLLQGIEPPSIARRFWLHIALPVSFLALAASGAMRIEEHDVSQVFVSGVIVILLFYFFMQCYKGRSKRIGIRKELLWTKSELQQDRSQNIAVLLEQHPPYDDNEEQEYYLGQTQWDFSCAHPCCLVGCYAEDRAAYELRLPFRLDSQTMASHQRQIDRDALQRKANMCRCLWDYACPAIWCGHQLQCCGICALAQEAREIESAVVPAAYRRIDYISMQPISQYYPAIYRNRHGFSLNASVREHFPTLPPQRERSVLSNLSWQLIQLAFTITAVVFLWCLMGKYFWKNALGLSIPEWRIFDWTDFIVYMFAWGQSITLTAILAYLCNRPCPTHLSLDAMIKFYAAGFCLSTALAVFWELFLGLLTKSFISLGMAIAGVDVVIKDGGYHSTGVFNTFGGDNFARTVAGKSDGNNFIRTFGDSHPLFYILYIAFAAFFLASFVEELCKYFGYKMLEHPDFMSQREIEESMSVVIQHGEEDEEERRHQQEVEQMDFSKQKKSVQSAGGAITLAMICVAMGFSCCENLVYIFVYSGSTLSMEISVLVARSLFPVHPIAAALASLRVIERDVEVTRTASLGGILAPSIIFHGCYDFFILLVDFLARQNGNYVDDKLDLASYASFAVSSFVIIAAIVYYSIAASRQRSRLQVTDASVESGQSNFVV